MSVYLDTEFGEVEIDQECRWYGSDEYEVVLTCGEYKVTVNSTSVRGDEAPEFASFEVERRTEVLGHNREKFVSLVQLASQIVFQLDLWNADEIAQEEERQRQQEQREQEEAEVNAAKWEERKELLLNECADEKVRVRHRGYKTSGTAILEVRTIGPIDEPRGFEPRLRWDAQQNYARDRNIETWQRVDLKTPRGWRTLWDDGKDDLPEYDRKISMPEPKPYG